MLILPSDLMGLNVGLNVRQHSLQNNKQCVINRNKKVRSGLQKNNNYSSNYYKFITLKIT